MHRFRETDLRQRTKQLEEALANCSNLAHQLDVTKDQRTQITHELAGMKHAMEQELWAEQQATREARVRKRMEPTPLDMKRLQRGVKATLSATNLRVLAQLAEADTEPRGAFEVARSMRCQRFAICLTDARRALHAGPCVRVVGEENGEAGVEPQRKVAATAHCWPGQ